MNEDGAGFTRSIGVSAVVRLRQPLPGPGPCGRHGLETRVWYPVGTIGMVIGQGPVGGDRYAVMIPGDPGPYYLRAAQLEVVQGVDLRGWWRRHR